MFKKCPVEAIKDYPNAKKYLSESVKYYPEDYSINIALGGVYYYLGEYENSYNCLTKALSINSDNKEYGNEEARRLLKLDSEKLG